MTVKCLGCANGVITQWIMLENVLVVRTYMLKYSGMKCYCFQIVQKKKKKNQTEISKCGKVLMIGKSR